MYPGPIAFALLLTALAAQATAQTPQHWEPAGRAAEAITGNIIFTPTRITFANGSSLPLAAAGTTRFITDMKTTVTANVYRVVRSAALPPYGGNTLCDGKKIAFLLIWHDPQYGGTVQLEPFTGPHFNSDSPDDCGRYAYTAAAH